MRLMIIRHADPDYPNDTITELGQQEAEALGHRLAGAGLTHLYSSPMGRARATADRVSRATGLRAQVLPWTAELRMEQIEDPDGRRLAAFNVAGEYVRSGSPKEWGQAFPAEEHRARAEQVAADSDAFLAGHGYVRKGGRYRVHEPNDDVLAVVCHAGFGVTWMSHLLALPVPLGWCGFFWAPTAVTTVVMEQRSDTWAVPRALYVGDTAHVRQAGLPESVRGLPEGVRGLPEGVRGLPSAR